LFFADGPRQVINGLTLYAIYLARKDDHTAWYNLKKYFVGNNLITTALTISTLFTVLIFAGSLLLLIVAAIFYVPLLCYIKGNLKVGLCILGSIICAEISILGVLLPQS
jgi:Fungal potassium channel